jgi:hypothetical protein
MIDRILRTGTLIIESAAQDPLEFNDIPHVERGAFTSLSRSLRHFGFTGVPTAVVG